MHWLKNKSECCGCGACGQICPNNCITMKEDEEGFLYPVVEYERCIKCGLCEKACPAINQSRWEHEAKVYAAVSKDRELAGRSSSGGMFGILARYVSNKNGVIFGAAYDEEMELIHCAAETEEEIRTLHGSKYIQSNTKNTFVECKKHLDAGRYVLYTGTPCQIAGLKQFLQKDYDELLTVELICHGVPSPGIWRQYIKELETESGHRVIDANFRYKDKGWGKFRFLIKFDNGEEKIISSVESSYYAAFFNNMTLRPSCHECKYRIDYTKSDLMIGDFWGVEKYYQDFDVQLGVSVLLVLSDKGEQVFREIKAQMNYEDSDLSIALPENVCIISSLSPHRNRQKMMESYIRKEKLSEALNRYVANYSWGDKEYGLGVWGSYNTRLVTQFLIEGTRQRRIFHYSNSSVISVMSDEKIVDREFVIENQYRKDALTADWTKSFCKQFDRIVEQTDYILIDMLEERFDLLQCGSIYITESDALKDIDTHFGMDVVSQEELMESGVWSEKLQQFIKMLGSKFSCHQIIILELYLNEIYFDGKEYKEFPDVQAIRRTNSVLKRIYELFLLYCPGVHCITVDKKLQYSSYNHRYGCIPSHLNYDACFELADYIYDIMVGRDK